MHTKHVMCVQQGLKTTVTLGPGVGWGRTGVRPGSFELDVDGKDGKQQHLDGGTRCIPAQQHHTMVRASHGY